jgi:hypothetical protein
MQPQSIKRRQVAEWSFHSQKQYENAFADIAVDVVFSGPGGLSKRLPAFYNGENTWIVRFNPPAAGEWQFQVLSTPDDASLNQTGAFNVFDAQSRGFLKATPGKAWGFQYESGEPVFLLGDTVYNLFGMALCDGDVEAFLRRRADQGFNLLRVRVPVSPFHPPEGYSAWQTRRTWPWGGSEQAPGFDRFNLEYFQVVDQVVQQAEALGIGLEMIMEAWGFEFPFNSRNIFVTEWEELWMRYLLARYDAYNCLYFWTPMNEYEFYPNGDWHYKPVADRWAMRVSRWIKSVGQHGHIVSVHNGPGVPPFARRFAADPGAVDAVLFQTWGTTGKTDAWLSAGIEEQLAISFKDWWGSAVLAEWGYERNPAFDLNIPGHIYCDPEHTRRGAWRGAFCGLGVIHGFENSWGPWMLLEEDQPGLVYLLHLRRFVHELVPFARMHPDAGLVQEEQSAPGSQPGYQPRALVSEEKDVIAVYFPAGGEVVLDLPAGRAYKVTWFNPRSGQAEPGEDLAASGEPLKVTAPAGQDGEGHPFDFTLILKSK